MWLHSSVGRASHRYRGGHGFESRWSPDFFFRLLLSNCLNWKIYCDDHISLSLTLYSIRRYSKNSLQKQNIFNVVLLNFCIYISTVNQIPQYLSYNLHFRSKHHSKPCLVEKFFPLCLNSFVVILLSQLHRMTRTSLATNFATSQRNSAWNSQHRFEVHNLIDNYVKKRNEIAKFVANFGNSNKLRKPFVKSFAKCTVMAEWAIERNKTCED